MIASEVPAVRATVLGSGFGVSATSWTLVCLTWLAPIDWSIWLILPIELRGLLETPSSFGGVFPAWVHVVVPLPPHVSLEVFWIARGEGCLELPRWILNGLTSLLDSIRQPSKELFSVGGVIASHGYGTS